MPGGLARVLQEKGLRGHEGTEKRQALRHGTAMCGCGKSLALGRSSRVMHHMGRGRHWCWPEVSGHQDKKF